MEKNGALFDLYNPSEEHSMLRKTLRDFVQGEVEPQALEFDRKELFNLSLFRKLGSLGLLGVTVPEEYGGSGLDALAAVIIHEELSASDPGFCLAYLAHSMLCLNNIAVNASEEQKKKYLPKLCTGEWVGAMGLSEPSVGTDVLNMSTRATKGSEGYSINGRKLWITNGTVDESGTPCDVLWLYTKTGEQDGKAQISTFIVEKGNSGFSVGQKIRDKCGMRASNTAELCFDDCKVALTQLVGSEGQSMTHMMRNLELERMTLAAMSLGIARRSIEVMLRYASERKAFGKRIAEFGQIQAHIANSYAEFQAARSYLYSTAIRFKLANNTGQRLDSDGVKLFATPIGKNIADRAIQVLGGFGYVGEFVVERLWRDAKLLEIGGGTIEAHQKNMTSDLLKNPDLLQRL